MKLKLESCVLSSISCIICLPLSEAMCSICPNWSFTALLSFKCLMILIDMAYESWDILIFTKLSELCLQMGRLIYPEDLSLTLLSPSKTGGEKSLCKLICPPTGRILRIARINKNLL